jgi:gamma-glutamyltranspeptidase / glutathione hydrolase
LASADQPPPRLKTPASSTTGPEPEHTTHYSVVDGDGNAVATTTTINGGYGSAVWVPGGGFLMNNEMDDFATQPGTANMFGLVQGEANAIQPGKRMLSAMSPTIVLDSAGQVLLVVGAAGGPTIITATAQVILNVIEHGMPLTDAMRAPRMHHQALPDAIRHETMGFSPQTLRRLRRMGHELTAQEGIANVNAVMRTNGVLHGVHEPRGSGGAVGY